MLLRRKSAEAPAPTPAAPVRRIGLKARPSAAEILARAKEREAAPAVGTSEVEKVKLEKRSRARIDEQLKLIAKAEADIDDAQARIESAHRIIEAQLRLCNISFHSDGLFNAELVEQWTRQARVIDPKKFKLAVSNDVFWKSISVNVGEAAKHLSEKEIAEIADVKPPQKQGIILKVARRRK